MEAVEAVREKRKRSGPSWAFIRRSLSLHDCEGMGGPQQPADNYHISEWESCLK